MTTDLDKAVEWLEPEERAVNILLDFDGSPAHACFPAGVMPFGLVSELIQKISDQDDALSSANARAKAAEEGLRRQADNMAFVLNHVELHAWHEKFERELAEDRATLATMEKTPHD